MTYRTGILLLADGARYDVFEELMNGGQLPNIAEHIVQRGAYSRMVSTFTSTTGPAYVPFLTGCYPGTANLPGIRWFDKAAYVSSGFWNPQRFRSYCGWEIMFINDDLRPDILTLFDHFRQPLNIFNSLNRGARSGGGWIEKINIALEKRRKKYDNLDTLAMRLFRERFGESTDFTFMVLQSIDGFSHILHPFHDRVIEGYHRLDRWVGELAADLKKSGRYDETLLGICSDHGLTSTHTHFDLAPYLESHHGLKTLRYTNIFRTNPDLSVQVSGNAMAHVYFKNHSWARPCYAADIDAIKSDLRSGLLNRDEVELLITRLSPSEIEVRSRRGLAVVSESQGQVSYVVKNGDPLGYGALPETMHERESLSLTWASEFPDAPMQIAQLFRSRRCGDMIVVSKVGYDLREEWENPEHKSTHGSLHRDHILVPFCLSHPFHPGPIRSADVYPTLLTLLGKVVPQEIDGKPFSGLFPNAT